jgi:hypothetical protein
MKASTRKNLENCSSKVVDYDQNLDTFEVEIYAQADKSLVESVKVDAGQFAVIMQTFDEPQNFIGQFFNNY